MDDNKKPGPRDISDLKARLGLKKTGTMPAVAPTAAGQPAVPAPVDPRRDPYAAQSPAASPAPPSPFRSEPGPAPAPADPRRDPFASQQQQQAAANLAAFYGIGQSLPGSADEVAGKVGGRSSGSMVLLGVAAAIAFGIGAAGGTIMYGRADYNRTVDQAGQIKEEVERLSKQLTTIVDTINSSKPTLTGQIDLALAAKLGSLDLKKPDDSKIFHTNYNHLEDVAIARLFNYYNHTIRLYDEITSHSKKSENDKEALDRFIQSGAAAKGDKNYGVIVEPQGGLMLAKFVEVGSPVCSDPAKTDCSANELKAFKYRLDAGAAWGERPVKGRPEQIVMPIQQTPLFKGVAAGNPDFLAVKDFSRRVAEIRQLAGTLMAEQKDVLADLKRAAERPKVFTF